MIDSDRLERLERLARLREAGALSDEEFAAAKTELLEGEGADSGPAATPATGAPRRKWAIAAAIAFFAAAGAAWLLQRAPEPSSPPPTARAPAAAAGPAAAAALPNLYAVIRFGNPAECAYAEPLSGIFTKMWRYDEAASRIFGGGPIDVPGLGRVQPQFTREARDVGAEFSASLPLEGLWHGLKVSRLVSGGIEESDIGSRQIHFREPPARVREVLNAHGFALPPVGQDRPLYPGAELGSISVEPLPDGAALDCS